MEKSKTTPCPHCAGEPEPGYIEMSDNGPIVPCPMCNKETDFDRAERQKRMQDARR
jgi:hypothetical protein